MKDSFKTHSDLKINGNNHRYFSLNALAKRYDLNRLPFTLKILLENLLRNEDEVTVTQEHIEGLLNWEPKKKPSQEIAFRPSRVILQDFTGVPAVVDLAAMRAAMQSLNKDPSKINPLSPVELVIDHSVMVDHFGNNLAFEQNNAIEFKRNQERYTFLRWGQNAFENFKVVPPGTGIVHQVNLEHLARVVFSNDNLGLLYPDTLVGTDSHTTMINGLGVLGWGVGGIEAEAAMLGQPITMLIPQVVGFELKGKLPEGATATDLVLTVTQMLRAKGVVGKFVEFYGDGLSQLSLADRATIANMAPEYGATCGIFPIDEETLNFLKQTGRDPKQVELVREYYTAQGLFHTSSSKIADYSDTLTLDLQEITPCIAGPKRPQDKIALTDTKQAFRESLAQQINDRQSKATDVAIDEGAHIIQGEVPIKINGETVDLKHGAVVISAITSCTNTSNPQVMLAAGLVAKAAAERGLKSKPWVKTSLAPGSQVVTDYLEKANLMDSLEQLGFNLVGYGCTTCIGNSGPLPEPVSKGISDARLSVCAVLSGNRNFEGRIHPQVQNAYLASPPLVVIYALAGTMDIDLNNDPIATDKDGQPVFFKDLWPSQKDLQAVLKKCIDPDMFNSRYANVFSGDDNWQKLSVPDGNLYQWDEKSTYVKHPPFFADMTLDLPEIKNIQNANVLVKVGDSVTTDHISPAGAIDPNSPAGTYLQEKGLSVSEFNSYGSRRGNHEVMMRGTFANIRLKNKLAPGTEGSWTKFIPTDQQMSIYDAAMLYQQQDIPLIVIGGKEYGTGSSRDWAAKGTRLLGVKAVIVESFERIHRSNLIGMGVLPLQFLQGQNADSLKLTGLESYNIDLSNLKPQGTLKVEVTDNGETRSFDVLTRIDTPKELDYFQHGGILHYVLRNLAAQS